MTRRFFYACDPISEQLPEKYKNYSLLCPSFNRHHRQITEMQHLAAQ